MEVGIGRCQVVAVDAQVLDDSLAVGHTHQDPASRPQYPPHFRQRPWDIFEMFDDFGEHHRVKT